MTNMRKAVIALAFLVLLACFANDAGPGKSYKIELLDEAGNVVKTFNNVKKYQDVSTGITPGVIIYYHDNTRNEQRGFKYIATIEPE